SSPYSHHRRLLSFPTRRSSDLEVELALLFQAPGFLLRFFLLFFILVDPLPKTAEGARGLVRDPLRFAECLDQLPAHLVDLALGADRKSTRLNSSHQIISYAVFC